MLSCSAAHFLHWKLYGDDVLNQHMDFNWDRGMVQVKTTWFSKLVVSVALTERTKIPRPVDPSPLPKTRPKQEDSKKNNKKKKKKKKKNKNKKKRKNKIEKKRKQNKAKL